MIVKFTKLDPKAVAPEQATTHSAGYDLRACIDKSVIILPHTTVKIGTGLSIEPPVGYWGGIFARSGMATKEGLRPANCVGICDEDYRGEYVIALHNDSDNIQIIEPNQKIAQLVFLPYQLIEWEETDKLSNTERGAGGFGSTGK